MMLYYSWLMMIKPEDDKADHPIDHKIRLYREDDGMY